MKIEERPFERSRFRNSLFRLKGSLQVDIDAIIKQVEQGIIDGTTIKELLTYAAETAASMATRHPDYSILGARIALKTLYRDTHESFVDAMQEFYSYQGSNRSLSLISESLLTAAQQHKEKIEKAIDHSRDNDFTYFGFQTLSRSYLIRMNGQIKERPQHLFMRVALGIHTDNIESAIETYDLMSKKYFIHATPTLFNAGTNQPQLSSCFLVAMKDDSIDGIFETLKSCAQISKHAGGIGLHVSNIRATHSYIAGTNGTAAGLVPMLRVFNNMARFVDQGGNRRPGAISITLEPWHGDIFAFLDLKKNHGKEEYRARDLFYALWIPDFFMKCVEENKTWYLFSPDTAPGLADVYGEEFDELYNQYVEQGLFISSVPAQKLWNAIIEAQIETGNPSILYKDACNAKSNQNNVGVIKSSNLCTEIVQYSDPDNTAVCNLASIGLPMFVSNGKFDHDYLHKVVKVVTSNLNKIIDVNYYPLEETEKSNKDLRPMAIGVQGLSDVFFKLGLSFDCEESRNLNSEIFETIYHAAMETSMELAKRDGPYSAYKGSPLSRGEFQFDLWHKEPSKRWDWLQLRDQISKYGVRNSLVTGVMPTASTSQILGFNECIEPVTSNIYSRRVLSGEFQVVNPYLVADLENLGMWNDDTRSRIIADNGSIQNLDGIPDNLKEIYRTVWELSQKSVIDMSADRAAFIDQSQSLNIFLRAPTKRQLTSMHFYGWKKGLKTGMYYLRTLAAANPIPVTIAHDLVESVRSSARNSPVSGTPDSKRTKYDISTPSSCDICAS